MTTRYFHGETIVCDNILVHRDIQVRANDEYKSLVQEVRALKNEVKELKETVAHLLEWKTKWTGKDGSYLF